MNKGVVLAHPGTQYSHQLACQLARIGYLHRFVTGLALSKSDWRLPIARRILKSRIDNRVLTCGIAPSSIENIVMHELVSWMRLKSGASMEQVIYQRNLNFQNAISEKLLRESKCVIGFDTSSWILAQRSAGLEKPFVLDQSIAHPLEKKSVFETIRRTYPLWSEDIPEKLPSMIALEESEHSMSSLIVAASTFTRESLIRHGVNPRKIVVNPYGVAKEFFRVAGNRQRGAKIRFLYLGALGARKGLPLLIDAWAEANLYGKAEVVLAGPANDFAVQTVKKITGFTYQGRLPYNRVAALMEQCDCLVFPSFFEGFGQVILEAMAAGMPVIATTATAGPDIIEHRHDGFIIPVGSKQSLIECMTALAEEPSLCRQMGANAFEKAKAFSWDSYGDRWKSIIQSVV